jgi:preprotein translocase subunit SecG
MAKKTMLILPVVFLILLLTLSNTSAYPCMRFKFREDTTNDPVTNVEWVVWACAGKKIETALL